MLQDLPREICVWTCGCTQVRGRENAGADRIKRLQDNLLAVILALLGALLVACKFDIGTESTGARQLDLHGNTQHLLLEVSSDLRDAVKERTGLTRVLWCFPSPYVETVAT